MDLASTYEISRTADFVLNGNFRRVALQFPDDLLRDSPAVAKSLKEEVGRRDVCFYVMADSAFGSCCVDEVGASHVDADCVVHYGHACMTPTSTLPALFVFGKESLDINACLVALHHCSFARKKPVLVLFGLEYAHAIPKIKSSISLELARFRELYECLHFANVTCNSMQPSGLCQTEVGLDSKDGTKFIGMVHEGADASLESQCNSCCNMLLSEHNLGGLTWNLPQHSKMEDYILFWIGTDNQAFANIVLTFNNCDIVRFDARENCLVEDTSHLKKILKRRYFLVEKAKDSNIVGILVGTLGIAGNLHTIQQIKDLVENSGKKTYTLVMGRPSPAKLANFPECDIFVYVSCAQTALLDSKEFLAPVITPFEAMLAFNRNSKWTGEYVVDFRDVRTSPGFEADAITEEARFSFLKGGYVEDQLQENVDKEKDQAMVLVAATEKALILNTVGKSAILFKGEATSGAEYLAARSFRGLEINHGNSVPQSIIMGRSGRASAYEDEKALEKGQK